MGLVLELPPDLADALSDKAARLGMPLSDYAVRLLASAHLAAKPLRNGAELVAYWRTEGVIGNRPDIADSQAHARTLREQAQRRDRE